MAAIQRVGAGPGAWCTLQSGLETDCDQGLPRAFHRLAPDVPGLMAVRIGPRWAMGALIGWQQDPRPRELIRRRLACGHQREEVLTCVRGSGHWVVFGWHTHLLGSRADSGSDISR